MEMAVEVAAAAEWTVMVDVGGWAVMAAGAEGVAEGKGLARVVATGMMEGTAADSAAAAALTSSYVALTSSAE